MNVRPIYLSKGCAQLFASICDLAKADSGDFEIDSVTIGVPRESGGSVKCGVVPRASVSAVYD